jgi:hypothetical protein
VSLTEVTASSPSDLGFLHSLHDYKPILDLSADQVAATVQMAAQYRAACQPRPVPYVVRAEETVQPTFLDNYDGQFEVLGPATSDRPQLTMVDTGAVPVILSTCMATQLGLVGSFVRPARVSIILASGTVEEAYGEAVSAVTLRFRNQDCSYTVYDTIPLITPGSGYDVILGREFQYHVGAVVDSFLGRFSYRTLYGMDDSDNVEHLRLLSNDEVSHLMYHAYPSAAAARACAVSALITDASATFLPLHGRN